MKKDIIKEIENLLIAYIEKDKSTDFAANRILEFILESDLVLGKDNPKGHVTASAWITDFKHEQVLLTHHKKLDMWIQLGGHTEVGESIIDSAEREALEESGLKSLKLVDTAIFDVDVHEIPKHNATAPHLHYDVRFFFEADSNEPLICSDESLNLKWIKLSEIRNWTIEPSVLRMVEKTLKG